MTGHRIVHRGTAFTGPVRVDQTVRQQLENLTALAPLHQPRSLAALDAVTVQLPDVPAVASSTPHSTPPSRRAAADDSVISVTGAAVATMVITAREDIQIAREARQLLAGPHHA